MKKRNFNPGPAVLPIEVIEQAQNSLINFANSGIGILEISHRSDEFIKLQEKTVSLFKEILTIPPNYKIVFCQGGATLQFSLVPMNFIHRGSGGAYLSTGVWSQKAFAEAKKFGPATIVASSEDEKFTYIPSGYSVPESASYLHYTSNNTIYGTQFDTEPSVPDSVPLIADTSSDLLCRPLPIEKYGLIYASAQKNVGPAGVTIAIIEESLLESIPSQLPLLCDYRTYTKHDSVYNTPPTFSIYVVSLVLEWIKNSGGLSKIHLRNQNKADVIYKVIDEFDIYQGYAQKTSRSLMNATFNLGTPELEESFLAAAENAGFIGLKGHRLLGGIRVSLYNALQLEDAEALADFMRSFAKSH
jgi:phosphoserine aminotransferase